MTTSSQLVAKDPTRLVFLDGLRGLAALYVVFYHVYHPLAHYGPLSFPVNILIGWAAAGRYAVALFIVLSGFVLMLPVTRSNTKTLVGGIRGFLLRRCRRTLPPYFVALAFSVVVVALFENQLNTPASYGESLLPVLSPGPLLSHVFLVHNLNREWIFTINSALWSVATEWHIYLVFAFVFNPLSKYIPVWILIPLGLALGIALHVGLGINSGAALWLLGLFAMGMLACEVALGKPTRANRLPWRGIGLAAFALFAALFVIQQTTLFRWSFGQTHLMVALDCLIGIATSCFIIAACQDRRLAAPLERRIFQRLGAFSYSLYLTHFPVLVIADAVLRRSGVSPLAHLAGLVFLAVPVAIALAVVTYWLTERPLLRHSR
jgi:peptidoglycan/LPS O-acetylase OafA/YrhL